MTLFYLLKLYRMADHLATLPPDLDVIMSGEKVMKEIDHALRILSN